MMNELKFHLSREPKSFCQYHFYAEDPELCLFNHLHLQFEETHYFPMLYFRFLISRTFNFLVIYFDTVFVSNCSLNTRVLSTLKP